MALALVPTLSLSKQYEARENWNPSCMERCIGALVGVSLVHWELMWDMTSNSDLAGDYAVVLVPWKLMETWDLYPGHLGGRNNRYYEVYKSSKRTYHCTQSWITRYLNAILWIDFAWAYHVILLLSTWLRARFGENSPRLGTLPGQVLADTL